MTFTTTLPAAIVALILSAASPTEPQQAQTPSRDDSFAERIAVSVVNVEVYVTAGDGTPVTHLERDDFEVLEDGRPVEVVNFFRYAGDRTAAPSAPATARASAQPEATAERPVPPGPKAPPPAALESQWLSVIVYVDNLYIHPLNRNRVLDRVRSFLREIVQAGDRVMVASSDRALKILQPFTTNIQQVSRTLLEMEGVSAAAAQREADRAEAVKAIYESTSLHQAQFRAKQFAENTYNELGDALEALGEMVDSLAGLPGRKMLLHVSDGLPMVAGQDLYQAVQQRFADLSAMSEAYSRDASREFIQLVQKANSNRVAFYSIEAAGLRTRSGFGAENPAVNTRLTVSQAVDAAKINNLQSTLLLMADRTGGQAVINTNDVSEGLRRFGRDFNHFYSLGYHAPLENRGRYHRIEVKLRDPEPGWRVRHREGYRDKSIATQIQDGVLALQVHGYETNPLAISIDVGPQQSDDEGLVQIPVRVRVPLENIVLVPRGDVYEARVTLYLSAIDPEGREAELQEHPLELRIPGESLEMARRDEVARIIHAKMRPGPHRLIVAARDEVSEERSIVGRFLMVGADERN